MKSAEQKLSSIRGWGRAGIRYPASEKLEIIRLVERSHLPAKQTLDMLGVPRTTFYRWYERYRLEGQDALKDKAPLPTRVWNRIADDVRGKLITLALDRPELSPRELAITFTDTAGYLADNEMSHVRGAPYQPQMQGKIERWHLAGEILPAWRSGKTDRDVRRSLQSSAIP